MAINDERAIKFANEIMRPDSEVLRNFYWHCKSVAIDWQNDYSPLFPDDPNEVIEDGRTSESDLSGEDANKYKDSILAFINMMEQPGVLSAIQKPCVRHLQVS